jgi:cytochrome c oxidase assembly protein subunit 15
MAARFQPSARAVRAAALIAVVVTVIVVVTGGVVRLTGSGLGCPTWPRCTEDSLVPTREMGIHGVIEFANRMLAYVISAAVGAVILLARARSPWRHALTRLGWVQFWLVMANAVIGGVTVLTGLNPYTVAAHFIAAIALLAVAVVTWERSREGDGAVRALVPRAVRQLAWTLVGVTGLLTLAGTAVTGTGKHAGDSGKVERMPFDWDMVAQLHADLAFLTVGLAVGLWFALRAVDAPAAARGRLRDLVVVLLAQGVIGYVQYFTDLPEALVAAHLLGASVLWIAVLRVPFALRERAVEEEELVETSVGTQRERPTDLAEVV